MNTLDDAYPPPVGELLKLGRPAQRRSEDYSRFGFTEEHFPLLVRLMNDTSFWDEANDSEEERPEVYAPIHAQRVIGTSDWPGAVDALLDHFAGLAEDNDVDWFPEAVVELIPRFGQAPLERLTQILVDLSSVGWARNYVSQTISAIGRLHPDLRTECVEILRDQLRKIEQNGPELNAFLIIGLIGLKATEAIEEIRAAYAADLVEYFLVGELEDVEADLGLRPPRPRPPSHFAPEPPGFKLAKVKVPRSGLSARERADARKKKRKQAKKH
jgi:hypothetical protein